MAEIRIVDVWKRFGKVEANRGINLHIKDGEFVVLLGPSGCGKTTLLRCIAGLERVDAGRIYIDDVDITDLPPRKRQIAMVFQSYAVFPHMTVFDNIAFGLRMQHKPIAEIRRRVQTAAELLQIEDLLERYPAQLSGGQRQRVAVARALAVEARVLLMDEPLSNLDALLRLEMRAELKRLLKEVKSTVVYVTHDQVEALSLGDRIAVMKDGNILQYDTPLQVYNSPANLFVGSFIGNPPMNFLKAMVKRDGRIIQASIGHTLFPLPEFVQEALQKKSVDQIWLGIRAENIRVLLQAEPGSMEGKVIVVEPLGSHNLLTVQIGQEYIKVNTSADCPVQPGQSIWLNLVPEKISWMDGETGSTFVK